MVLGPDADNANQMAVAHLTSTGALDTSLGNGGHVSLPGWATTSVRWRWCPAASWPRSPASTP